MIHEACKLWKQGFNILDIKRKLEVKSISTLELMIEMANRLGYANHIDMLNDKRPEPCHAQ